MVTMVRMDGFKIEVRTDHRPPHCHVTAADADLVVDLRTLQITAGSAPRKLADKALAWITVHQDELVAKWNELNERG